MFATAKQEISHALLRVGNYKLMKATQALTEKNALTLWYGRQD